MSHPIRFGVYYDFRNPPASGISTSDLYRRTLDQIRTMDQLGYDSVWMSEHHFTEDGYMPSPIAMSGAIAAATEHLAISQDVLLMPFQHPLRLAEDVAVLDNLSGGRMMLGLGMGYVQQEFQALGINRRNRVSLTEEGLEILRLAWTEDRFSYHGKRYQLEGVRVRPRPAQEGGPPIFIAAMSEAGARRAARFGAHLLPQGDRAAVLDPWLEAVAAAGRSPDEYRVGIVRGFQVADDPEAYRAEWRRSAAAEGERRAQQIYGQWISGSEDRMLEQLAEGRAANRLIPQNVFFGTPDQCIAEIERFNREFHVTDLVTRGVFPGQAPEDEVPNLERFANEVIPHFRTGGS
jgi:alkanesulfonate monooxygenase SsuD/methylene tetrahydromethanopterin reductase-like flavin-dependent oxidoreductase (luciferase family)